MGRLWSLVWAMLTLAVVLAIFVGLGGANAAGVGILGVAIAPWILWALIGTPERRRYPWSREPWKSGVQVAGWHIQWKTVDGAPVVVVNATDGVERDRAVVPVQKYDRHEWFRSLTIRGRGAVLEPLKPDGEHQIMADGACLGSILYVSTKAGESLEFAIDDWHAQVPLQRSDDGMERLLRTVDAVASSQSTEDGANGAFVVAYVVSDQYRWLRSFPDRFRELLDRL